MRKNHFAGEHFSNEEDASNIRTHPLTLSLPGNLEQDFLKFYNRKTVKQIRLGIFLLASVSIAYMVLDIWWYPSVKHEEAIVTCCFIIPATIVTIVISYFPSFYRYLQASISVAMLFRNAGSAWLMASAPNTAYSYFTGLLMGIMLCPGIFRLRVKYTIYVSLLVMVSFYIFYLAPLFGSPLERDIMDQSVDLVVCVTLGIISAYQLERYARRDYLQNLIIEQERARSMEIKLALEKERVSREIHDGISSEFTGILASAENLKSELERKVPEARLGDMVTNINTSARRGLQELRNIMMAIDPEAKTLGYVVAYLKRYTHDFLSSSGIAVDISEDISTADIELPPQIILTLVRITQEACHNIVKHAGANTVRLAFHHSDSMIELSVSDNGTGFTEDSVIHGRGITNMRKRTEKLDGKFTIISSPSEGTSISVILPIA